LQGLKADVVTYNQVTDVQILHDKGNLIPPTGKAVCRTTARRSTPPWVSGA
jgi:ABC-type sulfate transport system substrate-binding protein